MDQHLSASSRRPPFVDPKTLMENPQATFARLRDLHPVIQLGEGHYMVLRASDVAAMLTDPRTKQAEGTEYARLNRVPDGFVARFLKDFFLFTNGETHRTRRGLFANAFSHRAMAAVQDRIRAVAEEIVDGMPRGETFDFVERVAARVPAEMIATILGLPRADVPYFSACVYGMARAITPTYPLADHDEIEAAAADLFAYVADQIRARLETPGDDLLSALVADWRENQVIPFDNLVNQVLGMIIGGVDTTRAAFAMLVALLLQHPQEWAAVKADPALIPGAVDEGIRYEPSVGSVARFTTAPLEVGGVSLPAGVVLRVSTVSAMRDPDLYVAPDRFDIRRADHPRLHPVFGRGPHRCIGELLARLEMQSGLAALIAAAPEIELETTPRMIGFGGIRQITPMLVRIP